MIRFGFEGWVFVYFYIILALPPSDVVSLHREEGIFLLHDVTLLYRI